MRGFVIERRYPTPPKVYHIRAGPMAAQALDTPTIKMLAMLRQIAVQ